MSYSYSLNDWTFTLRVFDAWGDDLYPVTIGTATDKRGAKRHTATAPDYPPERNGYGCRARIEVPTIYKRLREEVLQNAAAAIACFECMLIRFEAVRDYKEALLLSTVSTTYEGKTSWLTAAVFATKKAV